MTGRPAYKQETCVLMPGRRTLTTPTWRVSRGPQGFRAGRGAADLAGRFSHGYRSPALLGWAGIWEMPDATGLAAHARSTWRGSSTWRPSLSEESDVEIYHVHRDFEVVMFGLPLRYIMRHPARGFGAVLSEPLGTWERIYEDHCSPPNSDCHAINIRRTVIGKRGSMPNW